MKKIIVCVDGSEQSFDAVEYVGKILPKGKFTIVLYHVMNKVNEAFFDMGINVVSKERMSSIKAWEVAQKKQVHDFMDKAAKILMDEGVSERLIRKKLHTREVGIARDIAKESGEGYHAVVVGRKGISKLKDLVMGSIAIKLLERVSQIPVWVIGERPLTDKIIVGLDSSEGSMTAIDYICDTMKNADIDITLMHVIRTADLVQAEPGFLSARGEKELIDEAKIKMDEVFDEARKCLEKAGIDPGRIKTKFVAQVTSRAGAIIDEAKKKRYGTIVVGRRGISRVEEFLMGRVSNKVVNMARKMAVWVVS